MDLLSLVLVLRPLNPAPPAEPLPLWWGRAAHALLLNVVRQADPKLAAGLHDGQAEAADSDGSGSQIKPFTASTLMGRFPQGAWDTEHPYRLRLTAFCSDLANLLWQAVRDGMLKQGGEVELDYHRFRIEAAYPSPETNFTPTPTPDSPPPFTGEKPGVGDREIPASSLIQPWMAATTFQELAADLLLARRPAPRRITLRFTSPTTFKSAGKHVPIPLPELVFGSLLERWNAHAPIAFPPETRRYAAECLAVGRYRLSSRRVPMKGGGLRIGAIGEITYTSLNYDRYWMSVIGTLAAFALFSGVGAGTSMGLGQARQVDSTE